MKKIRRYLNNADIANFRFWLQIILFIAVVYGGYLSIDLGIHLPTFSCAFLEKRIGTCFLWPLQHRATLPIDQIIGGRGIALIVSITTFFLLFIILNKAWCGWVCPLGTIQDWLSKVREKLGIRYSVYSEAQFKKLGSIKYILLALLFLIPFGIANHVLPHEMATPFCKICPGRTLLPLFMGDVSQLAIDFSSKSGIVLTAIGMALTGLFLVGSFFKERFFCLFCPMSAFHYIFSKAGLLRLNKIGSKCTKCGNCYRACDVGIREIADDVTSKNIVKDDCIMCFKCVAVCPEKDCLEVKALGVSLYKSTEEGFFKRAERKVLDGIDESK